MRQFMVFGPLAYMYDKLRFREARDLCAIDDKEVVGRVRARAHQPARRRTPGRAHLRVWGLWFMVYGLWFIMVYYGLLWLIMVYYGLLWSMVYGLWFMVYGLWFMVYGLWCMV